MQGSRGRRVVRVPPPQQRYDTRPTPISPVPPATRRGRREGIAGSDARVGWPTCQVPAGPPWCRSPARPRPGITSGRPSILCPGCSRLPGCARGRRRGFSTSGAGMGCTWRDCGPGASQRLGVTFREGCSLPLGRRPVGDPEPVDPRVLTRERRRAASLGLQRGRMRPGDRCGAGRAHRRIGRRRPRGKRRGSLPARDDSPLVGGRQ
jgi:hypothetical protein